MTHLKSVILKESVHLKIQRYSIQFRKKADFHLDTLKTLNLNPNKLLAPILLSISYYVVS